MKQFVLALFIALSSSYATDKIKLTNAYWNSLDVQEKIDILEDIDHNSFADFYTDYKVIEFEQLKSLNDIHYKPYKNYLSKVLANQDSISTEEIEQTVGADTGFATIGKPVPTVYLLTIKSTHQVLGAYVSLYQQGAHKEDASWDDDFSFKTAAQAKKAGFDPEADVTWSAYMISDQVGNTMQDSYFEWSGW